MLIELAPPVSGESTVWSRLWPARAASSCSTPYTAFATIPAVNQPSARQKKPSPRRARYATAAARKRKCRTNFTMPLVNWSNPCFVSRLKNPSR